MSRRANTIIADFSPEVEVHSTGETFLGLAGSRPGGLASVCQDLQATLASGIGVPACVGFGPTKTLAKLGSVAAKEQPAFGGVCDLSGEAARADVLRASAVEDVRGVGPATAAKLAAQGVTTAASLRDLPPRPGRSLGIVTLERTVMKLNGLCCLALEEVAPQRKGMAVTRSFNRAETSLDELREAVAAHATRAGEKLRQHGLGRRAARRVLLHQPAPACTATGRSTTASAASAWCP